MSDRDPPTRVVVRRPMNDHGTMTVELRATNETRQICEYAAPEVRRQLAALPAGADVLLSMSRVGVRADVWRAVDVAETPGVGATGTEPGGRLGQPL